MNRDHWLGVELRHFAALEAVAQERSFRRAADNLGYVQSAVSHQIASLEQLVGERLVERARGHAPVLLTPAGELLLKHANGILSQMRAARADLGRLAEGQNGVVRVGVFHGAAARVLPRIVQAFAEQAPQVRVVPFECPTDRAVLGLLESGAVDLGIAYLPLEPGPYAGCGLLRSPIVLLVADGSPLARARRAPSLEEIARLPLVAGQSCRVLERLEDQLRAVRGSLDVVYRSDLSQTTQGLVGAGSGVALMPAFLVDPGDHRTAAIAIDGPPPAAVGMVWHRERLLTPAAEAFGELAREVCADREDGLGELEAPPLACEP
jgi:DNA-binding transcriptional LysR family regulator